MTRSTLTRPVGDRLAATREADPDSITVRRFTRRRRARRWARLRLAAAVLLLAGLVAAAYWLVYVSDELSVQGVEVTGTDVLSREAVLASADVPLGGPLATADLRAIERRVASLAPVASVDVSRSWPHDVRIEVTERTAVAVVRRGEDLRSVDADGVLFDPLPAQGAGAGDPAAGLPRIDAALTSDRDALAEGAHVVAALPRAVAATVDHLSLTGTDDIDLVLRDGRTVRWGSAVDSDRKAEVLGALLARPGKVLDVSVPGQPTTSG